MSIRPSYGRRSVLQVLSDGMSQRPPTGTSCCEDAALNAAEVDRLTRERDTLQRCVDAWVARGEKAEAERDELEDKLMIADADLARINTANRELLTKLDVAEQRPTLDREAVEDILYPRLNTVRFVDPEEAVDKILALAPKVPSWPEWLGSRPVLRVPVRNVDDNWTFHDGNGCIDGDVSEQSCREAIEDRLADAVKWAGILSAIESEQVATGDEARLEEAKALYYASRGISMVPTWEQLSGVERAGFRAAIRAGWSKGGAA